MPSQTTADHLTVYYTNADNVLNKRDELCTVVNSKNPDVIHVIITEIYPKNVSSTNSLPVEFAIDGYTFILVKLRLILE